MKCERLCQKLFYFLLFLFYFGSANCYHSSKDNIEILTLLSQRSATVRVTIVGDSLSQWSEGFNIKTRLPTSYQVQDISKAGYDTELWLSDLAIAESIPTDIWVIELGTNDASYKGTRGFKDRYNQILSRLEQKNFSYFVLSAVPKTNQIGLHEPITANNQSIREMVLSNPKYRLADLEKVFNTASETISLYSIADPIHPNQIGYDLIGEEYRKILLGL